MVNIISSLPLLLWCFLKTILYFCVIGEKNIYSYKLLPTPSMSWILIILLLNSFQIETILHTPTHSTQDIKYLQPRVEWHSEPIQTCALSYLSYSVYALNNCSFLLHALPGHSSYFFVEKLNWPMFHSTYVSSHRRWCSPSSWPVAIDTNQFCRYTAIVC